MHHPGPWRVKKSDKADSIIETQAGEVIGVLSGSSNAALVAKAPELYDAVRELALLYSGGHDDVWHERLTRLMRQAEGGV